MHICKVCKNEEIQENDNFCKICGSKVDKELEKKRLETMDELKEMMRDYNEDESILNIDRETALNILKILNNWNDIPIFRAKQILKFCLKALNYTR